MERARQFEGEISVRGNGQESDLRSVMGLLMLQLQQGAELTVRVSGPGEKETCRALVELFETPFDYPPQTA